MKASLLPGSALYLRSRNYVLCTAVTLFFLIGWCRAGDMPLGHAAWSIRGCNYYPRDFPWGKGAMWSQCPASVYRADCARMKRYGINTVRVFLPLMLTVDQAWYHTDWTATANLLRSLEEFLTACDANGIRAIVCFDVSKPDVDEGSATINSAKRWFHSVIIPLRQDPRVLAWDVINEPDADPDPARPWTPNMANYVRAMYDFTKTLTDQPVTVGMAWRGDELKSIGVSPDIYQFHEYSGGSDDHIRQVLQTVRNQWPGTQILVGEFGLNTGGHTDAEQNAVCKHVLDAVSDSQGVAGTCFWTLWDFPGVAGAEGQFGLLRADGSEKPALQTLLWYY